MTQGTVQLVAGILAVVLIAIVILRRKVRRASKRTILGGSWSREDMTLDRGSWQAESLRHRVVQVQDFVEGPGGSLRDRARRI